VSYLFTALLATNEPPSPTEAREYLLEGALFDARPEITIAQAPGGSFARMELRYAPKRAPMVLRRLVGEEADASRQEAIDAARACGREEIAATLESAKLVLEWEVDRAELDEDAWFALHLWQASLGARALARLAVRTRRRTVRCRAPAKMPGMSSRGRQRSKPDVLIAHDELRGHASAIHAATDAAVTTAELDGVPAQYYRYYVVFSERLASRVGLGEIDEERAFYNAYYWFGRFVQAQIAEHGPDAGLEQQAHQLLEHSPIHLDGEVMTAIREQLDHEIDD